MKTAQDFLDNWRSTTATCDHISIPWNDQDLQFDWVNIAATNEVPADAAWNDRNTALKHQLQQLHYGWGYTDQSTQHGMAFNFSLTPTLQRILDTFDHKTQSHTALRLSPGQMLPWHYDSYSYFLHSNNLPTDDMCRVWRSAVMLTSWDCGQTIQIGDSVITHWQRGDVFSWHSYTWHGAANFGCSDMVVLQVSYLRDHK